MLNSYTEGVFMKKYILVLALFSSYAFAHDLSMNHYIKMQESLAGDNFKDALASHKVMCDKELMHYKEDTYKDCAKEFKSIDELRTSFKKLSEVYMAHGNKKEMKDLQKASCPMAEAKWVQKKGDLRNPYYGKSMLECGEKI
jgi:hypothetical protein